MGCVTVGVDVGQKQDPTALVLSETEGDGQDTVFTIRHLSRLPLGTSYPDVAARIAQIVANLEARQEAILAAAQEAGVGQPEPADALDGPRVVIDATGVGQPVVDLVREALGRRVEVLAVTFTHGIRLLKDAERPQEWRLGKAFLVSRLQVLLQTGRVKLPRTLETEVLKRELQDYEIKISEDGDDRYGAFRVGTHDDLVTALGLATLEDWAPACVATEWIPGWLPDIITNESEF